LNSQNAGVIIGGILIACFVVLSLVWGSSRGGSMLDRWASANGFQILSMESCWFFRGPFFWTSTRGQRIYRVTVRDGEGRTRSGYVRFGGYWLGLMSDRVDVRWDD
jgi:hypothetical protein